VSTRTIAGADVELNDEGFFVHPEQWDEAMGTVVAEEAGIEPMTDRHWQVVRYMRSQYLETGSAPSIIVSKGSFDGIYPALIMANGARMEELDFPSIPEFLELIHDSGAGLYACKASVDMFELTRADFIDEIDDIITVGEFYEQAAGAQIIFT
jgi:hypothetical protein